MLSTEWTLLFIYLFIFASLDLLQHEEVQFLENELENQKQKYQELASFTQSLLSAVRNNDLERQQVTPAVMFNALTQPIPSSPRRNVSSEVCCCVQELMASLPQPSDQDWNVTTEREAKLASSNHHDSLAARANSVEPPAVPVYEEDLLVARNLDDGTTEVTEPSASEEQLQEAVSEEKWLSPIHQLSLTHNSILNTPHRSSYHTWRVIKSHILQIKKKHSG